MRRPVRGVSAQIGVPEDDSDASLIDAISRGSVPAFVALFDRTSAAIRAVLAELPAGAGRPDEILASSYLEVWWLAGCHAEPGVDAIEWITGIARRRVAEANVEPGLADSSRPGYAQLELAALLRRPVGDPPTDRGGSPGR